MDEARLRALTPVTVRLQVCWLLEVEMNAARLRALILENFSHEEYAKGVLEMV